MLDRIGFYTLSEKRAIHASASSPLMRGEMILTPRCNFRCVYCRGLFGSANRELTWCEIKKGLAFWFDDKLENVRFSGGEPLLHPNLMDAVKLCKDKGVKRIAVSSNGSLPTRHYDDLIVAGVNDFSISLDACCSSVSEEMSSTHNAWKQVIDNISYLSKKIYVTVGIVLTEKNISGAVDTILFSHSLGVSDIRVIPAAQYARENIRALSEIPDDILRDHPVLKYRVNRAVLGHSVRGISKIDSHKCGLVLDDTVIAGDEHFPCVIYLREMGSGIGKIGKDMRTERYTFFKHHNSFNDAICRNNCLDVCIEYNNRYAELHNGI